MGDRSQTEYSTLAPLHSLNLEGKSSLLVRAISGGFSRGSGASQEQLCQPGAESPPKVLGVSICLNACFPCIVSFLGTSAATPERMQAWWS